MNSLPKKIDQNLEYRKFEHTETEIQLTAELLNKVWPDASYLKPDYLKWQYIDNPVGYAYGYNAWVNGEIVGHYAAIPIKAKVFGNKEIGLLSLNTAVREDFRGQNLFKILASKTYDHAKHDGLTFVVGVANQNSTLLFKRQLKFHIVSGLDVKLGIGRIVPETKPDDKTLDFECCSDTDFFQWRIKRPNCKYFKRGKFIFADTDKFGIKAQLTSRIIGNINLTKPKFITSLNPINLYIGLGKVKKIGIFFDLPEKFKPSPLNLIFKDLSEGLRKISRENCSVELFDFDAY